MADTKQPLVVSPAVMRRLAMTVGSSRSTSTEPQSQLGLLPAPFPALQRRDGDGTNVDAADSDARRSESLKLNGQRWTKLLGSEANLRSNMSDSALPR